MDITGNIVKLLQEETGTSKAGKPWRKKDFVIETLDQYPKKVCITVMGDKVDELSHYKVGNKIKASINLESREYNDKWFSSITAWRLEGFEENKQQEVYNANDDFPDVSNENHDDQLPF